jgi:hypothetical protein
VQKQREAGGETITDVLRRVVRSMPVAIPVVLIALVSAVIGVAFLRPPYQLLPAGIAIPLLAWVIRRGQTPR